MVKERSSDFEPLTGFLLAEEVERYILEKDNSEKL